MMESITLRKPQEMGLLEPSPGFLAIFGRWEANKTTRYEKENGIEILFYEFIHDEEDVKVILTYPSNHEPGIIFFIRVVKDKDLWFYTIPTDTQLKVMQNVTEKVLPIIESYKSTKKRSSSLIQTRDSIG
jgi:hypothetical protein